MAEYFVLIFSINVIRSVFLGVISTSQMNSHMPNAYQLRLFLLRASECFCAYMDPIFRHSGTDLCT